MKTVFAALSAALLAVGGTPAGAASDLPLPRFRSIELAGGGAVVVRYGPEQRVRLMKGSLDVSDIRVQEGRTIRSGKNVFISNPDQLVIQACRRSCANYELVVEVVTPSLEAVSVKRGGRIETRGAFPRQANVGAAVDAGGVIDMRSMPVSTLGAAVSGGGSILARVDGALGATVKNGGDIRYWGQPVVGQVIEGGGAVTRGG